MNKLTNAEVNEKLNNLNNKWISQNEALFREFRFKNFIGAFSFMTAVAFEAENENHHPLWENVYNIVKISLNTHDSGGITDKDFALAKIINNIYNRYQ